MRKVIADHRNEGFTATDAMYEHNATAIRGINKQIITKPGLKMYSDRELEEKGGPITSYNYNNRYSFEDFKAMPDINKQEYIKHLLAKYPGIGAVDLGKMFGVTSTTVISWLKNTSVKFPKKKPRRTEGKTLFYKEMVNSRNVVEMAPKPVQPEVQEPEQPAFFMQKADFICGVDDVGAVLMNFGFKGYVRVTAEPIEEEN